VSLATRGCGNNSSARRGIAVAFAAAPFRWTVLRTVMTAPETCGL
jgi:hypothetical protein